MIRLFCALLLAIPGGALAQVAVELVALDPPQAVSGQNQEIYFDWEKDAAEEEQRLVFRVQLHDADTDAVLEIQTLENGGSGYKGQTGSLSAAFTVPQEPVGIYYTVHAAPWSLNRWLIDKLESYPTDGTYTYEWTAGHYGVTQDLYYLGQRIAVSSGRNVTYCSGVAFEAFLLGYLEYNDLYGHPNIGGMSWSNMETFRRLWYGTRADLDPELKLAALAIPTWNLGEEITDWSEVQKGDALQFWRHSGSGHNPVFINWVRNASDEIIGIRYWGSQGSSNGIGYGTEYFGTGGFSINPDRTFFGRVAKPRDQGDVDFALGGLTTPEQRPAVPGADYWVLF